MMATVPTIETMALSPQAISAMKINAPAMMVSGRLSFGAPRQRERSVAHPQRIDWNAKRRRQHDVQIPCFKSVGRGDRETIPHQTPRAFRPSKVAVSIVSLRRRHLRAENHSAPRMLNGAVGTLALGASAEPDSLALRTLRTSGSEQVKQCEGGRDPRAKSAAVGIGKGGGENRGRDPQQ